MAGLSRPRFGGAGGQVLGGAGNGGSNGPRTPGAPLVRPALAKIAKGPDGTKGFQMGRGKGIQAALDDKHMTLGEVAGAAEFKPSSLTEQSEQGGTSTRAGSVTEKET